MARIISRKERCINVASNLFSVFVSLEHTHDHHTPGDQPSDLDQ